MLIVILLMVGLSLIGLLALILGIVALVRINRSSGALRGRGFAVAAIVIGALMLLAAPVLLLGAVVFAQGDACLEPHPYASASSFRIDTDELSARVEIDECEVRSDVAGLIRSAHNCSFDSARQDILLPLARRPDLLSEEQKLLVRTVMTEMDMDSGRAEVLKALIANPAFCRSTSTAIARLAECFDFDSSRADILKLLVGRNLTEPASEAGAEEDASAAAAISTEPKVENLDSEETSDGR